MEIGGLTLLKMQYMVSQLKPDDLSPYVRFEEDEEEPFEFEGKEIFLKKGLIVSSEDERIPWGNYSKYRQIKNGEMFDIISLGFVNQLANKIFSEKIKDYTLDGELFKISYEAISTILSKFTQKEVMWLCENLGEFVEQDEDVKRFLENFELEEVARLHSLYKLPCCLVLFWFIRKKQDTLIKNWMFSEGELRELLSIMNISTDVLS